MARAGAVFLCGSFLALTLWRPSPLFSRALISAGAAGVALVAWMMHLGIGWAAVREAVDHDLSAYQEAARTEWQAAGVPVDLVARMTEISQTVAQLYPALLAIAAVAGLRLAWAWYHRVSTRPLGAPPPPFPAFRFNDQFVWGWVLALGLMSPPGARSMAGRRALICSCCGLRCTRRGDSPSCLPARVRSLDP